MKWIFDLEPTVRAALIGAHAVTGCVFIQVWANATNPSPVTRAVFGLFGVLALLMIAPLVNHKCLDPVKKVYGWCVGCLAMPVGLVVALVVLWHMRETMPHWAGNQSFWLACGFFALAVLIMVGRRHIRVGKIVQDQGLKFPSAELIYILLNGFPLPIAMFLAVLALAIWFPEQLHWS